VVEVAGCTLGFCTGSSCRLAAIDTWFERRCEVGVEGHTYLVEGVIESESVVGAVICTCLQRDRNFREAFEHDTWSFSVVYYLSN
jgi:hypothetical protein